MSTAVWYMFLLVPVVAVAYVVWAYRKRAADKEARSRERLAALAGVVHGAGAPRQPRPVPATVAPATPVAAARPVAFLTPPENLLYHVLKAGLPDHEIFPHVSLAAVLGARAGAAGHDLDFVVCDKSMRVVAAIVMDGQARGAESLARPLASAGIRLIPIPAAALPRREQVRALIYGPPA